MYYLSTLFSGDFVTIPQGDGLTIKCPAKTPVYAASEGIVYSIGVMEDSSSYLILKHNDYFTHYSHLASLVVKSGDLVEKGQVVGESMEGFTFAIQSGEGIGAFIDPFGPEVAWSPRVEPILPSPVLQTITLSVTEHAQLSAQAANYRTIVTELNGIADFKSFLSKNKLLPIDLKSAPTDMVGGESVVKYVKDILFYIVSLREQYYFYPKKVPEPLKRPYKKTWKDHLYNFIWTEKTT